MSLVSSNAYAPIACLGAAVWVVLADYAAQVPYYIVNYYLARHTPPSASAIFFLSATLAWFLTGYFGVRANKQFGFWFLTTFLIVEGGFYLTTLLSGGVAIQLSAQSVVVKFVFLVGYMTGLVSLIYAGVLIVSHVGHRRSLRSTKGPST